MLRKRFFTFISLAITLVFIISVLPAGGTAAAQTPDGDCPPFNPVMAEQPGWLKSLPPECQEKYKSFLEPREKSDVEGQALSPGPDDYGYTSETVTYSWISAGTASGLAGYDDYASFDLGFNFPFYENTYSQVNISTNGFVSFGDPWGNYENPIPSTSDPNDFIAPFMDYLVVGSPNNSGAIYYSQGGSAPNRYFVAEWRNVTYQWDTSTPFTFEAILYENGNTVFQYQSLPSDYYWTAVGIEDSDGVDGLQHHYRSYTGLSPSTAVRFNRPTAPTARVKVTPLIKGAFSGTTGSTTFSFEVTNTGTNGTDTYDFLGTPAWSLSFYASDGTTLLTDTDTDTYIDTGPIAQGGSRTILARFTPPGGASVGDYMNYGMTVRSSLNTSKTKVVTFQLSIPSRFAGVFSDFGNSTFMLASPGGTGFFDIDPSEYGYDLALARTSSGGYIDVSNYYSCAWNCWGNIRYAVVGSDGSIIRSPADLIDNSGAALPIYDFAPAVAVLPIGYMGITWVHEVYNPETDQSNYNIYFEVLDPSGTPAFGPVNVTNNATWGSWSSGDLIQFRSPTIAATSDNRFVLGWNKQLSAPSYDENIWYAVYTHTAGLVKSASAFTTDNNSYSPVFNTLPNGNAILTWSTYLPAPTYMGIQNYAILNSSGEVVKSATTLSTAANEPWDNSDAVALPNGKIAVGWTSEGSGVTFAILDSAFNLTAGPTTALSIHPTLEGNYGLSMTTDYLSRVIFTWGDNDGKALFHALGDSAGTFLSPPLAYTTTTYSGEFYPNWHGQGNAPVTTFADVAPEYWAWNYVERLSAEGITGGCGGGNYCPGDSVTRGQMAVFLERGMNGSTYTPPSATGTVFGDVPTSYWSASWIEKLYADGITGGCGGGNYCPDQAVTRAQMAVFLLRAKHGSSYVPPPATGVFPDVPTSYWAASWIEQLSDEGITGGCGGGNYCPDQAVTRGQMAVFLVRTFSLP